MTPDHISEIIGNVQMATIKGHCHSCQTPVSVIIERTGETEMRITGGALFQTPPDWGFDGELLCKCDACFEKSDSVFRPCQVYSRVSGYYSPVKQWNRGKQAEFQERKTFRTSKFLDNN